MTVRDVSEGICVEIDAFGIVSDDPNNLRNLHSKLEDGIASLGCPTLPVLIRTSVDSTFNPWTRSGLA